MARIRSVKPELRTSEVVASWPREVRYAFVLLWGYLDDSGRGLDVPKTIAGDCFPHDDDVTPAKMNKWLNLMATTKLDPEKDPPLCRYEVGGRRYLHTVHSSEHQRPNRPSPSRLPPCPVHESLSEPGSEPSSEGLSEPLSETPLSGSLPGAAVFDSRGAEEQQRPRSEPQRGRHAAAAAIIIETTGATPAEAEQLAAWLQAERRPRNLAGLVRTIAATTDLADMLAEQRKRVTKADVEAAITELRRGPLCPHGDAGGAAPHPATGQPLCPLCRRAGRRRGASNRPPKTEDLPEHTSQETP